MTESSSNLLQTTTRQPRLDVGLKLPPPLLPEPALLPSREYLDQEPYSWGRQQVRQYCTALSPTLPRGCNAMNLSRETQVFATVGDMLLGAFVVLKGLSELGVLLRIAFCRKGQQQTWILAYL